MCKVRLIAGVIGGLVARIGTTVVSHEGWPGTRLSWTKLINRPDVVERTRVVEVDR